MSELGMNKSSNHQSGGNDLVFVLRHAVVSRLLTLFLLFCSDILISDHVPSGAKILSSPLRPPLSSLTRWDSAWFISIAEKGYPIPPVSKECGARGPTEKPSPIPAPSSVMVAEAEQSYAFFPLYPWCVRFVGRLIGPVEGTGGPTTFAIAGSIVSIVSFLVATCALHQLIKNIFHGRPNACKEANFTIIAFCWNPAGVFFSVCYTESIFAALVFTAITLLYAPNRRRLQFQRFTGWVSTFIFALATLARSNGILNACFIAYWGFNRIVEGYRRQDRSMAKTFVLFLEMVLQTALVISPMSWFQLSCYNTFCLGNTGSSVFHPWCSGSPSILSLGRPSLYSWVQQQYWRVGFLKYYQLKQIPNFILAFPSILLSAWGLFHYLSVLWKLLLSSALPYMSFLVALIIPNQMSHPFASKQHVPPPVMMLPLMVHWAVFLGVCIFYANIQVTTRLLAAACPPFHWVIGRILSGDEGPRAKTIVTLWLASYTILGAVLHANFYPWT